MARRRRRWRSSRAAASRASASRGPAPRGRICGSRKMRNRCPTCRVGPSWRCRSPRKRCGPGRRRRGGAATSILLIGALLVAGAWFGGKYARVWFGAGGTFAPASSASATDPAHAQQAAGAQAGDEQPGASIDAGVVPRSAETEEPTSAHREATAAHEAAHETAARHHGGGERAKDFVGRDIAGLKMAPDPSLLPSPAPAPPPKRADSPPFRAPASESP